MLFFGSPGSPEELATYRRLSRSSIYGPVTNRSIPSQTNASAQSPGLSVQLKANQALKVIRYSSIVDAHDVGSIGIFSLSPIQIVVTANGALLSGNDFSIADYAGPQFDSNSAGVTGSQAPPSAASFNNMLLDDWYRYDDFREHVVNNINPMPLSIFFQTVGWFRNTDNAVARSLDFQEFLLFEIHENTFRGTT